MVCICICAHLCTRSGSGPPRGRLDTACKSLRAPGAPAPELDADSEQLRRAASRERDKERIATLERKLEETTHEAHETESIKKEARLAEDCPTFCACRKFALSFGLPNETWDERYNICFCNEHQCATRHSDLERRGNRPYGFPKGWCGLGLKIDPGEFRRRSIFDWDVAFHGTRKDSAIEILQNEWQLLMPGEVTPSGYTLPIRPGHIKGKFSRINRFTGKREEFDPVQVFTSPSIHYCAYNEVYVDRTMFQGREYEVAFQLRQKPGSYSIGQETVGAQEAHETIDHLFPNDELEYYTKRKGVHKLYRLLIRPVRNTTGVRRP